jgi:signal transduction histidine kinase
MGAKGLLEEHMLENPLSIRASEIPLYLMDRQVQAYAQEVRRLFHQTRRLSCQLTATEARFLAELREAITAQDEEREWIALEVHDRIAQTLAAIFQQLQSVEGMARSYPEMRQAAVRGSLLCREAIQEARNIMNDLQPPVLNELGLVPAMEDELRRLAEETSSQVTQALILVDRPSRTVEVTLYRIFREALVNIHRHARATAVEVSLTGRGEGASLEIRDNGIGFVVEEAMAKKRVGGLLSMRRRAELAGGAWHLQSQPGNGTRVCVWIPLSPPPIPGGWSHRRWRQ